MEDTIQLVLYLSLFLNLVFFILGYIVAKIYHSQHNIGSQSNLWVNNRSTNNVKSATKIAIDESKYVTDINLSGIEKKYDELGDTKVSNDQIASSVDKLKNLKR